MSHTVKIQTHFKTENLNSFRRALEHFGWKIVENAKIRTYSSDPARNTVYGMIAQNPGSGYDMGLKMNEETGELEVFCDYFDGSITKALGQNMQDLKQEYSCCVIEDKLAYDGYTAARHVDEKGVVDIYAE